MIAKKIAALAVSILALACRQPLVFDEDNQIPIIRNLSASVRNVAVGGSSRLTCTAFDPDDEDLSYSWRTTVGTIDADEERATWAAPSDSGVAEVTVTVDDGRGGISSASLILRTHVNSPRNILVDATHDGGVWWFPQSELTGFSENEYHQGQALADYIRSLGFQVDELPRGVGVSDSLLHMYDNVIRAGKFGNYSELELEAYDSFLKRQTSLILISEFLSPGLKDELAERLGIPLVGVANGSVARFEEHEITHGVTPIPYIAGSVILDPSANPDIEVLGRLSHSDFVDLNGNDIRDENEPFGAAVMGVLHHPTAKVFFIGEINGIERVPQPFVSNLVKWAFE